MDSMDGRGRNATTGRAAQHRAGSVAKREQYVHTQMDEEMLPAASAVADAPPLVRKLSKSKAALNRRGSGAHLSVLTGQTNMTDATEKMTRNLSSITTLDTEDEGGHGGDMGFGDNALAREIMNLRQNSDKSLDFNADEVFDEDEEEEEEEGSHAENKDDEVMWNHDSGGTVGHNSQSSLNSSSSSLLLQSHGITLTDAHRRLILARYQRERESGRNTSSARAIALTAAASQGQTPSNATSNQSKLATNTVPGIQQGSQQKGKSRRASDRLTVAELRQQGKMPTSRMRSQADANLSGRRRAFQAKNAQREYSYQKDNVTKNDNYQPPELRKRDSDEELAEIFADKISTDGDFNYDEAEDARFFVLQGGGGTVSTQCETVEVSKEDDATVKQSSRSSSASPSRKMIDSPRVGVNRRAEHDTARMGRTVDSVSASHQATHREVNVAAARIYVGTGISTDISVASSITDSHAVVPGSLDVLTTASCIARGHHPSTIKNRKARRSSEQSANEEESINRARVASWLSKQCLERYFDKFIEEGYDSLDRVRYIDKSELERMEILPGHRRSLYHAILVLRRQRPQTNLELISEESLSENPSEEQTTVESSTIDARPPSSHGPGANSGSNTSGQEKARSKDAVDPSRPRRVAQRLATSSRGMTRPPNHKNLNSARQALRQDQDRIKRKISSLKSSRRIGGGNAIIIATPTKGQMLQDKSEVLCCRGPYLRAILFRQPVSHGRTTGGNMMEAYSTPHRKVQCSGTLSCSRRSKCSYRILPRSES